MKTKIVILIVLLMLSACKTTWHKDGASHNEFEQDKYQCMQESVAAYPTNMQQASYGKGTVNFDASAGLRDQMFFACLRAHGWTRVQ